MSWRSRRNTFSSDHHQPREKVRLTKRDVNSADSSGEKINIDLSSYLQTLAQEGKDAATIMRAAVSNFAEIAFPPGENTTLTQAVSNVVREVEATHKELEGWQIQEALLNSIKEQTSKLFGGTTERTAEAKDFESRIAELSEHQQKPRSQDGGAGLMAPSALIVLGVLTIVLMFTSLMGVYFYCKQRGRIVELERSLNRQCEDGGRGTDLKAQEQHLLQQAAHV